jgi:hypothetical protein
MDRSGVSLASGGGQCPAQSKVPQEAADIKLRVFINDVQEDKTNDGFLKLEGV